MPKLCRIESMCVWMSLPPTRTVPDVGGNKPVRIDLVKQHEKNSKLTVFRFQINRDTSLMDQ